MMRLLIITLFLFSITLNAQDFPISEKTGKVSYEGVVKVDGVSATDLYIRANEWFAKTFNSANAVIQMQDKEAGKIIGKGWIAVSNMGYDAGGFDFRINFTAKEGRYRYIITDIEHDKKTSKFSSGGGIENEKPACGTFLMLKGQWRKLKKQAHDGITEMHQDLVLYMSETNSEEDDW